jgi:hypothetical protein
MTFTVAAQRSDADAVEAVGVALLGRGREAMKPGCSMGAPPLHPDSSKPVAVATAVIQNLLFIILFLNLSAVNVHAYLS